MKGIREEVEALYVDGSMPNEMAVLIAHIERLERFASCQHRQYVVNSDHDTMTCRDCGAMRTIGGVKVPDCLTRWHLPIDPPNPAKTAPIGSAKPTIEVRKFGPVSASVERQGNGWWLWRVGDLAGEKASEEQAWEIAEQEAALEQTRRADVASDSKDLLRRLHDRLRAAAEREFQECWDKNWNSEKWWRLSTHDVAREAWLASRGLKP